MQPSYDGPYPVVLLKEKYFHILIDGKNRVVKIDRLKPAFMTSSSLVNDSTEKTLSHNDPTNRTARYTRLGRKVRFSDRLVPF